MASVIRAGRCEVCVQVCLWVRERKCILSMFALIITWRTVTGSAIRCFCAHVSPVVLTEPQKRSYCDWSVCAACVVIYMFPMPVESVDSGDSMEKVEERLHLVSNDKFIFWSSSADFSKKLSPSMTKWIK